MTDTSFRIPKEFNRAVLQRLGRRLRRLRESRRLSLRRLAKRAELTEKHIRETEHAMTNPSAVTLARLAEALGVEVGHLFDEPDAPLPVSTTRIDELLEAYHQTGRAIARMQMEALRRIEADRKANDLPSSDGALMRVTVPNGRRARVHDRASTIWRKP